MITGQEKIIHEDALKTSCTIETADLQMEYDVAIIDEIQMIADVERGSAWTQAFLALKAKTIYCCGEDRALGLI